MPRLTPDVISSKAVAVLGTVEIDAEVAIAAGVILIAEPGSRLVISQGVCLGAAVIVRARQGDLIIEPEATLGSGVVVVGQGRIGTQACIGSGSTVINPHLAARSVVPPRSLVGDPSRALVAPTDESGVPESGVPLSLAVAAEAGSAEMAVSGSLPNGQNGSNGHSNGHGDSSSNGQGSTGNGFSPVYGRDQVQQLLDTLFPHRQPLDHSSPPRSE